MCVCHGKRFAAWCCLQVALPQDYIPTPFVAAGVALLGCAAGIMVTASHNTKEYNGYKVWFEFVLEIVLEGA